MGIKQEIEHTKTLLNQGFDLLLLRLQVINLDLAEQAENAFRTLLALLFSAVLLFIALFAALFGPGPSENNVLHGPAAQAFSALFSHDPGERIHNI